MKSRFIKKMIRRVSASGRDQTLQSQRGAVAVEFGLLLPLLAVILFGIIDFGRMLWFKEVLVNATRDGARLGTLYSSGNDVTVIKAFVQQALQNGGVSPQNLIVTAPGAQGPTGTAVTVTSTMDWDYLVIDKLLPASFSPATTLTATITMMNE